MSFNYVQGLMVLLHRVGIAGLMIKTAGFPHVC